jgi:hypothetical protein
MKCARALCGRRSDSRATVTGRRATECRLRCDRGQAAVELLGALPAVLLVGLVLLQLLAVGYSAVLAGVAAESGALAIAGGVDARSAARAAVPGWARAGMRVTVAGGRVRVVLAPPAALAVVSRRLEVRAEAAAG